MRLCFRQEGLRADPIPSIHPSTSARHKHGSPRGTRHTLLPANTASCSDNLRWFRHSKATSTLGKTINKSQHSVLGSGHGKQPFNRRRDACRFGRITVKPSVGFTAAVTQTVNAQQGPALPLTAARTAGTQWLCSPSTKRNPNKSTSVPSVAKYRMTGQLQRHPA